MNLTKLTTAIAEADRFIKHAEALRELHLDNHAGKQVERICGNPREQGAVKRASMDLTRALADLRKPS